MDRESKQRHVNRERKARHWKGKPVLVKGNDSAIMTLAMTTEIESEISKDSNEQYRF